MSKFGNEIKDFVNTFTAVDKANQEAEWKKNYYAYQTKLLAAKGAKDDDPDTLDNTVNRALKDYGSKGADAAAATPDKLGSFDTAVNRTLGFEGGLNTADTNGTPSNMGINGAAHPGVDVASLSQGQAKQIYKSQYWDGIGGDDLAKQNPALAHVAFDTAVIAGPGKAKQLMAAAGGDPAKMLQLRKQFQDHLLASNPGKYGKYAPAWKDRLNGLSRDIGGSRIAALDDSAPDQQPDPNDQPVQSAARGGMIRKYANGGAVGDDQSNADYFQAERARTPDAPNNFRTAALSPATTGEPAPEADVAPVASDDVPVPPKKPADLPQIIDGALRTIQNNHSLDQRSTAVADGPDPKVIGFHKDDGGVTPEDVKAIDKKIDPDGKLDDTLKGVVRLQTTYNWYLSHGQLDKANQTAASLVQYARQQSMQLGTIATKAAEAGDDDTAAAALQKAHDVTPTGTKLNIDPKTKTVTETDMQTGKVVTPPTKYTPEMLLQMARATSNGSLYMKELMKVGAKYLPAEDQPDDKPSDEFTNAMGALGKTPAEGEDPVAPKFDTEAAAKMSKEEQIRYQGAHTKALADYKATAKPANTTLRPADRVKLNDQITKAFDALEPDNDDIEAAKKAGKEPPVPMPKPDRKALEGAAFHISADPRNQLTPAESASAAIELTDPKQPAKVANTAKGTVAELSNGSTVFLSPDAKARLGTIRAAKLKAANTKPEKPAKGRGAEFMDGARDVGAGMVNGILGKLRGAMANAPANAAGAAVGADVGAALGQPARANDAANNAAAVQSPMNSMVDKMNAARRPTALSLE